MKRTLNIIRWILGMIFIIAGIGSFKSSISYAVSTLLLGISLLPLVWNMLEKRQIALKKWMKYVIPLICFALCLITVPETTDDIYASKDTTAVSVTKEPTEPEVKQETKPDEEANFTGEVTETPTPKAAATPAVTETPTPEPAPVVEDMTVHFLDVGQGLSVFVQSGEQNLIYDGGDRDDSSFVVAYLKKQGVETIDYLISSHYDADHVSGLIGCLKAFDVKNVIGSDYVHDSKTYTSFMNAVDDKGLSVQHPAVGEEFEFGTGKFIVLAPESIKENESNDNSVVIKLINGDNSFIFTGDAESSSESDMCRSGIDLSCDVLVPSHHGSATATSWEFLQETLPEYAVISCGKDNQYGHPHKDTMDKLESMETQIFRTDVQGTIIVHSDGTDLEWSIEPCNDYSPGEEEDAGTQPQEEKVSTPKSAENPEPTEEVQKPEQGEMVWISETGSKYHNKPDCGRMNPDKAWQMSRSDAESSGYEACKKCY